MTALPGSDQIHRDQRSDRLVTVPLAYWDSMCRKYWESDDDTPNLPSIADSDTVTIPADLFWRVSNAYYGKTEPDGVVGAGDSPNEDADESSPTTQRLVNDGDMPERFIPRGRFAARMNKHNAIRSGMSQGSESSSTDDRPAHESGGEPTLLP